MARSIVALDGSPASEAGLNLAVALAASSGDQVDLVHVLPVPSAFNETFALRREGAEQYLLRIAQRLDPTVVSECVVLTGNPAAELRRYALRHPGSTVVLGARDESSLRRRVFGSVARSLLESGDIAVAIAGSSMSPATRSVTTVLVPLDGSRSAEIGIDTARSLDQVGTGLIRMIRVVQPALPPATGSTTGAPIQTWAPSIAELSHEARDYLHHLSTRLRSDGVRGLWEVRTGQAADEILRAAETTGCELIILVNRPHSRVGDARLSDVIVHLAEEGTIPLLIVPAHDSDGATAVRWNDTGTSNSQTFEKCAL
jgi:nucleotide-binding universal stress UspA family protein